MTLAPLIWRSSYRGILLAIVAVAPLAVAQSTESPAATQNLAFEVASVRMVSPYTEEEIQRGLGNIPWSTFPTNRFTAHRLTLKLLIGLAYGIDEKNIEGDPSWLDEQHYDVEAKVEDDKILTYQQMKPLLQHLLEQRFHLATHLATKPVSGYWLVVAKGGPKLQPGGDIPSTNSYILPNAIESPSTSLSSFASMLSRPVGSPILDKTGITGNFNIKLSYASPNNPNSNLPSVFTAIVEQLGLKLVSQKVPADFLIIDHVDKVPTEN